MFKKKKTDVKADLGKHHEADAPDDRLKQQDLNGEDSPPVIFKMIKKEQAEDKSRRNFLKNLATGTIGLAGAAAAVTSVACKESAYMVHGDGHNCTCHVVCTCDTVSGVQSTMDSYWDGQVCTCNTVCVCDTVGSSDSGGSDTYWYPN